MKVATLVIAASTMRFAATTAEEITTPLQRLRSQQSRHASSSEEQERRRWGRVLAGDEVAAPTMMSSSMSMMSMTDGDISMPSLAAMCAFCPDGLTDPDLVLPTDDQATCAMAQGYATSLEESDPNCAMVGLAESLCCAPAAPTIYDLGASDPNFSILISLVDAAGLAEAVQGPGPLTLFGE
jgi:hypothetical protein